MLELLFQFGLGFTIALSGALFPGSLLAFITMKTLKSGPKTGTLATSGHIIVELGLLFLIAKSELIWYGPEYGGYGGMV